MTERISAQLPRPGSLAKAAFRLALALSTAVCAAGAAAAQPFAYVTSFGSATIAVYDTKTLGARPLHNVAVAPEPASLVIGPRDERAFVVHLHDHFTVLDLTTRVPTVIGTHSFGADVEMGGVDVSPDGRRAFVAIYGRDQLAVIDVTVMPPRVIATLNVGGNPDGVAVSPDGRRVYVANAEDLLGELSSVSVIDATVDPPVVLDTIAVDNEPHGIAVAPDGERVYVVCTEDQLMDAESLMVIDVRGDANVVVDRLKIGARPYGLALAADGSRAYVSREDGKVAVVDLTARPIALRNLVRIYNQPLIGLAATPDGRRLFVPRTFARSVAVVDLTARPPRTVKTLASGALPVGFGHFVGRLANHAPVAVGDVARTSPGQGVPIDVLGNDYDIDRQTLRLLAVDSPNGGSVALRGRRGVVYTPHASFSGEDSFTYTVGDGKGATATARVTVTVE